MTIIKVILFPINENEDPEEKNIDNSLESLYKTIDCDAIETMSLPGNYVLIFDEYGRINNSFENKCMEKYINNPNFTDLHGKILLCKATNGYYSSIDTDIDMTTILNNLSDIVSQHMSDWIKFTEDLNPIFVF